MCGTTKGSVVAGYYNPGALIHHDVGINTVSFMTSCRAAYRYESILSGSSFGLMPKVGCSLLQFQDMSGSRTSTVMILFLIRFQQENDKVSRWPCCFRMWLAPSNWLQSSIFLGFSWLFLLSTLKSDTRAVSSLPQAVLRNGSWLAMKSWKQIWRPLEHWGVRTFSPYHAIPYPFTSCDTLGHTPTISNSSSCHRHSQTNVHVPDAWCKLNLYRSACRAGPEEQFFLSCGHSTDGIWPALLWDAHEPLQTSWDGCSLGHRIALDKRWRCSVFLGCMKICLRVKAYNGHSTAYIGFKHLSLVVSGRAGCQPAASRLLYCLHRIQTAISCCFSVL